VPVSTPPGASAILAGSTGTGGDYKTRNLLGINMPAPRRTSLQGLLFALALLIASLPVRAADWLPISTEELQMSSAPKAPAAPAIYLYRQVDRDDNGPSEMNYERIKILSDEGRQFANIEISYFKNTENIRGIQARTIHPDGRIVNFDGTIFDKPIVQGTGVKLMAKTFTLPDVQVGSIIEYRYRHELRAGYVSDSHWILSQDLFTQYAKFSLDPYRGFTMRYSWPQGLPPGTAPPKESQGRIRLETRDVPAFVTEQYMPPENSLKYRVDFIYYDEDYRAGQSPEDFWQKYAKRKYSAIEKFLDQRRAMTNAVAHIVESGDSPETKLRKIYARTQQLRNLSFERTKTQQEADRDKLKDARDVEDVWNHGYGSGDEITWLFLGLLRAAGIDGYPVLVSTRDTHFFDVRIMNPADLNTNLVVAIIDGKEWYLDPGSQFASFGMLPWAETGVIGLRPEKNAATWIHTPAQDSTDSRVERKAALQLTPFGTLEGKVTVTYSGQEALWRRLEERHEDEADRKQFLEDQIKADIPSGAVVELTNKPEWESSASALVAEYDLKVQGWAAGAGQRSLLAVGLFGAQVRQSFQHATRLHPIYFKFPHQEADDVAIALTPNWTMTSAPQNRSSDFGAFKYVSSSETANGSLHLNRELTLNGIMVETKYYPTVQRFFELVRAGDRDQAVLTPTKNNAAH
jgi:Domain of Unknown Function with PDB structure (DUF3857)